MYKIVLSVILTALISLMGLISYASSLEEIKKHLPPIYANAATELITHEINSSSSATMLSSIAAKNYTQQQVNELTKRIIDAKKMNIPVDNFINKVNEGISKNIPPEKIMFALDTLKGRYKLSVDIANQLIKNDAKKDALVNSTAAALSAGITPSDIEKLATALKNTPSASIEYYVEVVEVVKEMARIGITSRNASDIALRAISKNFNTQDIKNLKNFTGDPSFQSNPNAVADSLKGAIDSGLKGDNLKSGVQSSIKGDSAPSKPSGIGGRTGNSGSGGKGGGRK